MSNCNNDCENCKIEDFCGYSVDTLGYAEFSRVVEEHDAKVRTEAIDEFADWLVEQGILGNRCISDGEITNYGKVYSKKYKERLKEEK